MIMQFDESLRALDLRIQLNIASGLNEEAQRKLYSISLFYRATKYERDVFQYRGCKHQMNLEPALCISKATLLIYNGVTSLCEGDLISIAAMVFIVESLEYDHCSLYLLLENNIDALFLASRSFTSKSDDGTTKRPMPAAQIPNPDQIAYCYIILRQKIIARGKSFASNISRYKIRP